MSTAQMLPYVWAHEANTASVPKVAPAEPINGIIFYRKRTELLLRRYMMVSMQMGRVPSLLGNSVFRGKASHYKLKSFEDGVIFLFDIERCLKRLDARGQELIARIGLQEYTQEEAAELTGQSLRTVIRKYGEALDELSRIFIDLKLMDID